MAEKSDLMHREGAWISYQLLLRTVDQQGLLEPEKAQLGSFGHEVVGSCPGARIDFGCYSLNQT